MALKRSSSIIAVIVFTLVYAPVLKSQPKDPPIVQYMNHPWVDSVLKTLTPDQQIAQCIWVAGWSDKDVSHAVEMSNFIEKYGIGGVVFFQGTPEKQAELTNFYQKTSRVPLIISTDAEWGIGMRLTGVEKFPYQTTLGAIQNDSLIYEFDKAVASQFKRLGVHVILAPYADINANPQNPVINVIITDLLKNELGFKGLVITDSMNMQGLTKYFNQGEADTNALEAGNDVIVFVTDVEAAMKETKNFIAAQKLTSEDITHKARKILALKYWGGLNKIQPVSNENIGSDLSAMSTKSLIRELYANAMTVLKNHQNILPLKNLDKIRIATVAINRKDPSLFQERIASYIPADNFFFNPSDTTNPNDLPDKLSDYDIVIAGVFGNDQRPYQEFEIETGVENFINELVANSRTIITWFGNPFGIDKIESLSASDALILAYQENDYNEDLAPQLIFGGIGARGTLPVTINEKWPSGHGIITPGNLRLQYGIPESVGISSEFLRNRIDSIVSIGMAGKAYPGCEIIIAHKGMVIFQKSYGYHTYDKRVLVKEDDLFDLASVTKISSSLPGFMLLDTEGKFSPDNTLGSYLPYYRRSNKGDLLMRDIFAHQAGITGVSFWRKTIKDDGRFKWHTLSNDFSKRYPVKVAHNIYVHRNFRKKMFSEMRKRKLGEKKYNYTDLTFIITPEIIETITGEKWHEYVITNIYKRIGAYDLGFNPYLKYPLSRIVPTEYDSLFRKQQLVGTVHDETAGMLGGISGHAGLFTTANDLLKLMELYRRMGEYGGEQIIGRDVMEEYTSVQFPENDNRRGLGFDKPLLNNSELTQRESYPTKGASPESFGHSGYTGTFVWVDPVYEISYVFLSNRVYPTRNNSRLSDLNIRSEILQAIYDSLQEQ